MKTPGWERNEKCTHSFEDAKRLAVEMIADYVKNSLGDIAVDDDGTVSYTLRDANGQEYLGEAQV